MKQLLRIFLLLLTSIQALAGPNVVLNWTAPTTYADGVLIEPGKVLKYDIWRSEAADMAGATRLSFDLVALSFTDAGVLPHHTYYYTVRAYFIDTLPSQASDIAVARVWPPFKTSITSITVEK